LIYDRFVKRRAVLEVVAGFSHSQHGLFTRAQVNVAGVTDGDLERLRDDIERIAYGVWRFRWSPPSNREGIAAALLAVEPTVALWEHAAGGSLAVSYLSAAALLGFGNLPARRHELTTSTGRRTRRADIHLHHAPLPEVDLTTVDVLPVTTPMRTLTDIIMGRRADPPHMGDMVADAIAKEVVDPSELDLRLVAVGAPYTVAELLADAGRSNVLAA